MTARRAARPAPFPGFLAVFMLLAVAACGLGSTTPTALPTGGTASPAAPTVAGSTPGSPSTPAPDVVLDVTLLRLLPETVEGIVVESEPQAFADALSDADFVANVEAAVFPIAAGESDLASGVVAELRAGTWSDSFFRSWRDSYDAGACSQAGGAARHAEAELGGRTVHITSCAEGLVVYHAWVEERDTIVSMFSLGPARFGERLMAGIAP